MQKKTDLYFLDCVQSERLRLIKLLDNKFLYDAEKTYTGYLGINVNRVKLIAAVLDLRMHKIDCFSVPIEYRDRENIPFDRAIFLAKDFAINIDASIFDIAKSQLRCPPVYWIFGLKYKNTHTEKVGGVVMIDRLDGHVWTDSENEEYMYDYNNVL